MELISRQQAIDAIKERYYKYGRFAKIEELVWSIEKLPPIQPEIVRCKDCYNWDMSWDTDMPNCHFCAVVGNVRNAEEFCSFAERREVTT